MADGQEHGIQIASLFPARFDVLRPLAYTAVISALCAEQKSDVKTDKKDILYRINSCQCVSFTDFTGSGSDVLKTNLPYGRFVFERCLIFFFFLFIIVSDFIIYILSVFYNTHVFSC
jgi:hypothetical protein